MSDPILIDTASFTAQRETRSGDIPLAGLDGRISAHELLADNSGTVRYRISGGTDRWQRPFLDLAIKAHLQLVCQHCLQPLAYDVDDTARLVLFRDEAALDAALTEDEEADGMVYAAEIDVLPLLEDQLLMTLPFAPRHADCDNPRLAEINQDQPNPFAQLAGLKAQR